MQYNAGGAATMGMLHVYSDSKITGTPGGSPPAYAIVGGTATFEDTLILQGGTTGSAANLGLSFTLDGMANFTNANGGDLFFYLFAQPTDYSSTYSAQTCHFVPSTGNVVVTSVVTCPNLAVTFGQSFFLTVSLSATTNVRSFVAGSTANLDYANTAALSGITVTDSLGNAVAFSINSASGATYTANGVVPEPSSGPVVAISLFCLGSLVLARRNVRR